MTIQQYHDGATLKVVIPGNLDLPSLILQQKPGFCFKPDRCKYILNQLAEQFAYNRRLIQAEDGFPYIPLSSAILVRHVYNYDDYLILLCQIAQHRLF